MDAKGAIEVQPVANYYGNKSRLLHIRSPGGESQYNLPGKSTYAFLTEHGPLRLKRNNILQGGLKLLQGEIPTFYPNKIKLLLRGGQGKETLSARYLTPLGDHKARVSCEKITGELFASGRSWCASRHFKWGAQTYERESEKVFAVQT